MSKNNKILPYVIFGLPLLVGGFFLYKYIKSKKTNNGDNNVNEPNTSNTPIQQGVGTTYTPTASLPFKKGTSGEYVKIIQRKLNINDDGKFGNITKSKVVEFQRNAKVTPKLEPDGIVGAKTWKALFGADFPNQFESSASNYIKVGSTLVVPKYSANQWD
jgi:peptidoglycan hydrolase-like protein with peptidoglycan-binding domain